MHDDLNLQEVGERMDSISIIYRFTRTVSRDGLCNIFSDNRLLHVFNN